MSDNTRVVRLMISLLFLSFIYEISCNPCEFNVKLEQIIHNEGFHRNITYSVIFHHEQNANKGLYKDCIIGLEQTLPAGVYTSPDELGDLRRTNRLNAIPRNRVNIELPAEISEPSAVYIMDVVRDNRAYLWLPVHARYHQAVPGGGTARNEIVAPKLFLRCPDQRLNSCNKDISASTSFLCNGSSKEKCTWKVIPYTVMSDTLIWDVPVGDTDQYYVVAAGTAIVILIGSLYLLKTIHEYKVKERKKML
ncbi:phosphatidylinositol glycan anchor biosynthesis class X [Aphomia sociella]